MHILVVDDLSTMRRILTRVPARMGFPRASEAANGKDALARIAASPGDLVIVDWNMPGMSGPELTRAIRSSPATRDIPVLMVTANATSVEVRYARLAGVSGSVVKPFGGETLKQQIASVLRPPAAPDQPSPVR